MEGCVLRGLALPTSMSNICTLFPTFSPFRPWYVEPHKTTAWVLGRPDRPTSQRTLPQTVSLEAKTSTELLSGSWKRLVRLAWVHGNSPSLHPSATKSQGLRIMEQGGATRSTFSDGLGLDFASAYFAYVPRSSAATQWPGTPGTRYGGTRPVTTEYSQ